MATPGRVDGFATLVENEFETRSTELMQSDLEKSGLSDSDIYATPLKHPPVPMQNPQWVLGAYRIPYFDREGNMLTHMYRDRLFYRSHVTADALREAKMGKYKGPSLEFAASNGVDARMPYLLPGGSGAVGIICEGEKKTAAALARFETKVLGIGGCNNWSDGNRRPRGIHEDIIWWVEQHKLTRIVIIADPDITNNSQIAQGYAGLVMRLIAAFPDIQVSVVALKDKLDDLLMENADYALADLLAEEPIETESLEISKTDMIEQYDLVFRETDRSITFYKNVHNVCELLHEHPKWKGQLAYNSDELIYELYNRPIIDKKTEAQITAVFNRNLHFPDIGVSMVRDGLFCVCLENSYSPSQVDINSAPKWDGEERLKYIFGEGRSNNEIEISKAFVMGYVKRVLEPGCFWRIMTILVGPQGVGKTGMARWLAGAHRRISYFHPGELGHMSKDFRIRLMNSGVALFDDIETFGHREQSYLKALVTLTSVREREPYGRFDKTFYRRGVMMATANHTFVVPDDPTGNTRYVVITLTEKQDFVWLNENRGQIIAEARVLVEAGYEPQINFKEVSNAHADKGFVQIKLEEWKQGILDKDKTVLALMIEGRRGHYFKEDAFWTWAKIGVNAGTTQQWERSDFRVRAMALGFIYYGASSIDRAKGTDNTIKNVWSL